jgi:transcriptional regulator with XRE-family HTH domain
MHKIGRESLSEYVKRVVKQKDLKLRDIERNSEGKITNGYISGIVNGKITNLSVDKLKALALGLDVDAHDVFAAAIGEVRHKIRSLSNKSAPNAQWLIEIMQEVLASPELTNLIDELVHLSRKERAMVMKVVQSLIDRERQSQVVKEKRVHNKKRA